MAGTPGCRLRPERRTNSVATCHPERLALWDAAHFEIIDG